MISGTREHKTQGTALWYDLSNGADQKSFRHALRYGRLVQRSELRHDVDG